MKDRLVQVSSDSDLSLIEPNYDAIARLIEGFAKLYEVANDKSKVDIALDCLFTPTFKIISDEPIKNL